MAFTLRLAAVACLASAALVAQQSPDEALQALRAGNQRFAADKSVPQPVGEGVRRTLARGQSPFAVVLCCADSRVPPEHVFNAGLGELLVLRTAGHTVDAETLALLEQAVADQHVPLAVVLGHEQCDVVAAGIAQVDAEPQDRRRGAPSPLLQALYEQLEPAVRKAKARDLGGRELQAAAEEEHAQWTIRECLRRSAVLRRHAQAGRFRMVGARYAMHRGEVEWLPGRPLPAEPEAAALPVSPSAPMGVPPHVALRLLQAGHRRFLGAGLPAGDLTRARREQLTHGQSALAIVLCCSDSRLVPELLFDAGLGELQVVRTPGGVLTDAALASIEQAALQTGASLLLVLGHEQCHVAQQLTEPAPQAPLTHHQRALLARLEPVVEQARRGGRTGAELTAQVARLHPQRVVAEARARSAILRQLEQQGRFAVLGAVYDLGAGDLAWLKEADEPAAMPPAAPAAEPAPAPAAAHGDRHGHAPAAPAVDHAPAATAPPGGDRGAAHPPAAGHGQSADPHGAAAPAHPPATGAPLPVLDWAAGHGAPAAAPADGHHGSHAAPDAHAPAGGHAAAAPGADHGHGGGPDHAAPGHGGAAPGDAHADPHADAHAGADRHGPTSPWRDPIVLVGIGGVASLLLAALVAVLRK